MGGGHKIQTGLISWAEGFGHKRMHTCGDIYRESIAAKRKRGDAEKQLSDSTLQCSASPIPSVCSPKGVMIARGDCLGRSTLKPQLDRQTGFMHQEDMGRLSRRVDRDVVRVLRHVRGHTECQFCKPEASQRGPRRRLQHDGAPCGGTMLPRGPFLSRGLEQSSQNTHNFVRQETANAPLNQQLA